jgi:hypothetical protein
VVQLIDSDSQKRKVTKCHAACMYCKAGRRARPNLYAGVMKVRKQHKRTAQTLALVAEI